MMTVDKNAKTQYTIPNASGTKAVNISKCGTSRVRAAYVQIYNGEEQVLMFRAFATFKLAERWAAKVLA